jgi:hypothetical protein
MDWARSDTLVFTSNVTGRALPPLKKKGDEERKTPTLVHDSAVQCNPYCDVFLASINISLPNKATSEFDHSCPWHNVISIWKTSENDFDFTSSVIKSRNKLCGVFTFNAKTSRAWTNKIVLGLCLFELRSCRYVRIDHDQVAATSHSPLVRQIFSIGSSSSRSIMMFFFNRRHWRKSENKDL